MVATVVGDRRDVAAPASTPPPELWQCVAEPLHRVVVVSTWRPMLYTTTRNDLVVFDRSFVARRDPDVDPDLTRGEEVGIERRVDRSLPQRAPAWVRHLVRPRMSFGTRRRRPGAGAGSVGARCESTERRRALVWPVRGPGTSRIVAGGRSSPHPRPKESVHVRSVRRPLDALGARGWPEVDSRDP